jgi:hypothetical protein
MAAAAVVFYSFFALHLVVARLAAFAKASARRHSGVAA